MLIHLRFEDGADDPGLTTSVRTALEADLQGALELPGPESSAAMLLFVSGNSSPKSNPIDTDLAIEKDRSVHAVL